MTLVISLVFSLYLVGITLNLHFMYILIIGVFGVAIADFLHTKWLAQRLDGDKWARARFYKAGYVYIAEGNHAQWMKIGFSEIDPTRRQLTLNSQRHAGVDDWTIVYYKNSEYGGRLEWAVQKQLSDLRIPSNQLPPRRLGGIGSREVFRSDLTRAKEAIDKLNWIVILNYGLLRSLRYLLPVLVFRV